MPAFLKPRPSVIRLQAEVVAGQVEPAIPGRPAKTILALSGGGSYGAFTAGVLTGWSRTNTRPEFDVVTGVSTGALIAPLAFLGPDYDRLMRRFYTEVGQTDIFKRRYWAAVPFAASVATSGPLHDILDYGITPEVVAAIAAEHRKGRRLYVATTRLDTRETVVWDVGAIAARPGGRKMVIDVLLASCSVPGVFPPVAFRVDTDAGRATEWHVDGGTTAQVFVPPAVLEAAAPGADLYVMIAGKYYPDPAEVKPRLLKVLGASGLALMSAHLRHDVANVYHMAKLTGVNFHVVALRRDFTATDSGIEFDTAGMNRLYVEGVEVGLDGPVWRSTPVMRGPGDEAIRTGLRVTGAVTGGVGAGVVVP